jgi:N-acetylmuramidase-like protein
MMRKLVEDDYVKAADELNCDIAALKAVEEVESLGKGYLHDGRIRILFEAHIFHRLTRGRFDRSHPHLSSPKWNRALYVGDVGEWDRLNEARLLDEPAAFQSASYGKYQIMGFNHAICGYPNVRDFVAAMTMSERHQLEAFINFIKARDLDDELQRLDWRGFARIYNGPAYEINSYHVRLASAYRKFSTAPNSVEVNQ